MATDPVQKYAEHVLHELLTAIFVHCIMSEIYKMYCYIVSIYHLYNDTHKNMGIAKLYLVFHLTPVNLRILI